MNTRASGLHAATNRGEPGSEAIVQTSQNQSKTDVVGLAALGNANAFVRPMGARIVADDDFPRPMSCRLAAERADLQRLEQLARRDAVVSELLADITGTVLVLEACQRGEVPPGDAIDSALIRLRNWFGDVE
jgi:hypothetical protein